jgi:radical SAM superfamily enzyme YgiQ (UPF0313 family)
VVDGDPSYLRWYEEVYPRLTGAGVWLRGGELNTLPPDEREHRLFRVLFARLSTYHDCGASFTHPLLYQIASGIEGVYPDLGYLPPAADLPLFAAGEVPWLLGTQSKRGPLGFDLLGLSLSIVQELLNLPRIMKESGIPLARSERLRRPELPLVILGGASALFSSVAWGREPWIDAVFVGEDPRAIRCLLETCRDGKAGGLEKPALLEELARLPGVLRPEAPGPVRRAACADLDRGEQLARAPVLYHDDAIGSGHLQLSEGCPCFCSFCAESWDRKPYRERSASRLLAAALELKAAQGLEEIELSSASFNAYRELRPLLHGLAPLFARIRLKSQRLDLLAEDPELLEIEHALGKTSMTCGLEGISPRLRRYLHKSLEESDLQRALEAIFAARARELKLFLIATGLEEEEDFAALDDLLGRVHALSERQRAGTRVIVSLTPLVRFPATPLEFEDAPDLDRCEPILRRIASSARRWGFEYRSAAELPETFVSQILVRAADPRTGRALRRALEETEFLYYRQVSRAFVGRFRDALTAEGTSSAEALRGHGPGDAVPWSGVEVGVEREFLWQELARLRRGEDAGYCLGRTSVARARCQKCGACTPAEVAALTGSRPQPWPGPSSLATRLREAREAERPLRFLVHAGPAARGLPRKHLGVALVRALCTVHPGLAPSYRRYGGAQLEQEGVGVWLEGEDVLTLFWNREAEAALELAAASVETRSLVDAALGAWGSWLGLAPVDWSPRSLEIRSPFEPALDPFLRGLGLKFERRRLEGGYALELTPASKKKGILRELRWERDASGETLMLVVPGPKLDLQALLREGFALVDRRDWVRTHATVVGGAQR